MEFKYYDTQCHNNIQNSNNMYASHVKLCMHAVPLKSAHEPSRNNILFITYTQ